MSRRHPPGLDLSRYADGELNERQARDVACHLEACAECRDYVAFIHELAAAVDVTPAEDAEEPTIETAYDLSAEVLRRRRAGERVALGVPDTAGHGAGDRDDHGSRLSVAWRLGLSIAAAFALFALAGVYLFEAPPVAAGHSELDFGTELATPGSTLDVAYTPTVFLAGYDSLRLRIRARAEDTPYPRRTGLIGHLRTVTLHRGDDGRYRGALTVAPDELFLAACVEDFSGEEVDTNLGRLWDLLVAPEDGEPSIQALESRYRVLEANNAIQAVGWAKELTERYPENPFGWALLRLHHARVGPFPMSDSLVSFHSEKLKELIEAQSHRPPRVEELVYLFNYARWNGNGQLRDSLLSEIERVDPGNPAAVNWRAYELVAKRGDPQEFLTGAERLWALSDPPDRAFVLLALSEAADTGDEEAVRRWVSRAETLPDLSPGEIATELDDVGFAAPERARLRREQLASLSTAGEEQRPLGRTVGDYARDLEARRQQLSARLGVDLAAIGDTTASLRLLRQVAADAWTRDLLEPYADLLLATGDTATALPLLGILASNTISGADVADRYDSVLRTMASDSSFIRESAAEFRRRIRASMRFDRRLPDRTVVRRASGVEAPIEEVLAGGPSILVLFEADVPGIAARLDAMRKRALDVLPPRAHVLFVGEKANPEVERVIPPANLAYDPQQQIAQYLHAFGVLDIVVLDADISGFVRPPNFESALVMATAL